MNEEGVEHNYDYTEQQAGLRPPADPGFGFRGEF